MSKISSDELKELLAYANGTENYWKHSLLGRKIIITDGVKLFADKAEAYWFLDEILINKAKLIEKAPNEYFFNVLLKVENHSAKIQISYNDFKVVLEEEISYTDCPDGFWGFFYDIDSNVLMLPGEY